MSKETMIRTLSIGILLATGAFAIEVRLGFQASLCQTSANPPHDEAAAPFAVKPGQQCSHGNWFRIFTPLNLLSDNAELVGHFSHRYTLLHGRPLINGTRFRG